MMMAIEMIKIIMNSVLFLAVVYPRTMVVEKTIERIKIIRKPILFLAVMYSRQVPRPLLVVKL